MTYTIKNRQGGGRVPDKELRATERRNRLYRLKRRVKPIVAIAMIILLVALILAAVPVAAQGGPRTYQVERGDTWRSVAREYGIGVCRLVLANGHVRCSTGLSRRLLVGQTLRIPRAR